MSNISIYKSIFSKRKHISKQYFIDNTNQNNTTRNSQIIFFDEDENFLFCSFQTYSDKVNNTIISPSCSINMGILKINKNNLEISDLKLFNQYNKDSFDSNILDNYNNPRMIKLTNMYIYILLQSYGSSTKTSLLKFRKKDLYGEESIKLDYDHATSHFYISEEKIITFTSIYNSTNRKIRVFNNNSFSSMTETTLTSNMNGKGNQYNSELFYIGNNEYVCFHSSLKSSNGKYIYYSKFTIDPSTNIASNLYDGYLTIPHFTSNTKINAAYQIKKNTNNFLLTVSDVTPNLSNIILLSVPLNGGNISNYRIQISNSNEKIGYLYLCKTDSKYYYFIGVNNGQFTANGNQLPQNSTYETLLLRYKISDLTFDKILLKFHPHISNNDTDNYVRANYALMSKYIPNTIFLNLYTNSYFKRIRIFDAPSSSKWKEPVIIKVPL